MLVREDHAGGEGSCWRGRIMLVVEDSHFRRSMISVYEKLFFAQNGSLSVRSQHKSQKTICQVATDPIPKIVLRKTSLMSRSTGNVDFNF